MTLHPLPFFRLLQKCGMVAAFLLVFLGGCNKVKFKVKKGTE